MPVDGVLEPLHASSESSAPRRSRGKMGPGELRCNRLPWGAARSGLAARAESHADRRPSRSTRQSLHRFHRRGRLCRDLRAHPAGKRMRADPERGDHDVRRFRGERRSEEHTSELQSHHDLVCRLLLEKKKKKKNRSTQKKTKKKKKKKK